jgi:hypothetical protein
MLPRFKWWLWAGCTLGLPGLGLAQIDPIPRELIQVAYHKEIVGHAPFSGYGVYYRNDPGFLQTNLTLRTALAPVYVDSELGLKSVLGPNTDLGFGIAGGGFAYSYEEVRRGQWLQNQSWTGHGAGATASLYHLFNPDDRVPLYGVLRGGFQYSFYERDQETAPGFVIPQDQPVFSVRSGLRYGGQEFDLIPEMAMELSAWYEGQFRLESGRFGFNGDRVINPVSHLFWGRALLDYTLPELRHRIGLALNAGTSINPDRFSAYRVGGMLSLASPFPYPLPGYYFGELSAKNMILLNGFYEVPLDKAGRWWVGAGASTAFLSYTPGLDQPNHWNSGVGGGLSYHGPGDRVKISLNYGYGIDAFRSGGYGGHAVAIAIQFDLGRTKTGAPGTTYGPDRPSFFQRFMRLW